MSAARPNFLAQSGKPLFFLVDAGAALDLEPPAARLGESIRLYGRSLSLMQKEALVASSRTGAVWRLASDEGAYLAGLDEAACPLAFFTTGMVSSYMTELLALAERRRIAIHQVRLVLDNYYTMVGSTLKGTMTAGAKNAELTAQIASDADHDTLAVLVREATAVSPLNGLVRGSLQSRFSLTHNGRELGPGRFRGLDRPAEPDPERCFEEAQPGPGGWATLIRRGGKTPKQPHTVTLANDSLAEQQSRLLHVRGICTLRDDGVKKIEQHLYNPHGSIFHFLCDEAPINRGGGRAPDAASYVAAGIAFCFMTQFGRYAKIAHRNLERYRVVQDLHLSLGVASAGTEAGGVADPVETHVYIDSREDDDFARTLLDMSEQTCFLHAFCRTDLETRVSVQEYTDDVELPAPLAPGV